MPCHPIPEFKSTSSPIGGKRCQFSRPSNRWHVARGAAEKTGGGRRRRLRTLVAAKPQSAWNSVTAMAISGLWLASRYVAGRSACSAAASARSGCAWIESAFATESTCVRARAVESSIKIAPFGLNRSINAGMAGETGGGVLSDGP